METEEHIAEQVIAKYLRKGNMSRCLRDILPTTQLTKQQRETVADIVHDVVRWKKLYDFLLEKNGEEKNPQRYVQCVFEKASENVQDLPSDYRYSCSSYVASLLEKKVAWAEYLNQKPPTTLCVNFNKSTRKEVEHILKEEGLPTEESTIETALRTTSIGRYSSAVKNNLAHVQDESSQLISVLTESLGDSILDYCAGNGGKSLTIASLSRNQKKLSAFEINPKKRLILEQRCKQNNALVTIEQEIPQKNYDVVLVDAPCSGLGVARRNPEAKYIENAGEYPAIQLKILEEATHHLASGGTLVYSVCTFTPEETKEVVKQFSRSSGLTSSSLEKSPYHHVLEQHTYGSFTKIPEGDIFFVSLLKKKK